MVASRLFLKTMQLMQGIDQGLKWKLGTNTNTKEIHKIIYYLNFLNQYSGDSRSKSPVRGHSTTTWTPTCVDSFYTLSMDKDRHFWSPPPLPSSYPRNYWMAPYMLESVETWREKKTLKKLLVVCRLRESNLICCVNGYMFFKVEYVCIKKQTFHLIPNWLYKCVYIVFAGPWHHSRTSCHFYDSRRWLYQSVSWFRYPFWPTCQSGGPVCLFHLNQ